MATTKDVIGDIYLITNKINGKMYVGQTRCANGGYIGRWKDHLYVAARKEVPKWYIDRAIQKHGPENFELELLERRLFPDIDSCVDWMDEREVFFIKEYDTRKHGYNLTDGGKGNRGWIVPDSQRKQTSERMKGRPGFMTGKRHSAETIAKISEKNRLITLDPDRREARRAKTIQTKILRNKKSKRVKPVIQYDLNGLFVMEYESQKQAAEINCLNPMIVGCGCRTRGKNGGFYFRFKSDFNGEVPTSIDIKIDYGHKAKPVDQFSLNGDYIGTYPSAVEAAKSVGVKGKKISACIAGDYKTYKGYIWKLHNKQN